MEVKEQLEGLEKSIKEAVDQKVKAVKDEVNESTAKAVKDAVEGVEKDVAEAIKAKADELQAQHNALSAKVTINAKAFEPVKKSFGESFSDAMAEAYESKAAEFKNFAKDSKAKISFDLKVVGNMTIGANLTGDGVAAYNSRQGLLPSQSVNIRDLIPTTQSPTGLYVTYRETTSEGAIAVQTEGAAKGQIDYDLSEVKVVSDYIAGFARFSKQMMYQLPFLQSTLSRMLLRDFYKKENEIFYAAINAAATGTATTAGITVDAEQLVAWIANQKNANFNASAIIVNWSDWQSILLTKPSNYSIPGGVKIDDMGNIRICGVPVIGASWATIDKMLLIDTDFVERVETESLRVELSYEDSDNFTKNLVTARVECFEDINLLRTDAHIFGDFGNVA